MSEKNFMELKIPKNLNKIGNYRYVYQLDSVVDEKYVKTIWMAEMKKDAVPQLLAEGELAAASGQDRSIAYWKKENLMIQNVVSGFTLCIGKFCRHGKTVFHQKGGKLVFTAAVSFPAEPEDLPDLETVDWIDRTKFKSDATGIYDRKYVQVFVADTVTGECRQITHDRLDFSNAVFMEDHLVVCTAVPADMDISDDTCFKIIDLESGKEQWIPGAGGPVQEITVSPTGKEAAVLTHENTYWEATNYKLYLFNVSEGKLQKINIPLDRSIGDYIIHDTGLRGDAPVFCFSEDGGKIYARITDGFYTDIYEVHNGSVRKVTDSTRVITEYLVMQGSLLLITTGINSPAAIENYDGDYHILWEDGNPFSKMVTRSIEYEGHNGKMFPARIFVKNITGLKGIVLDIHGGPHFCHGMGYSLDVQLLTEAGYAVVYANPAGSQGGGEMLARASYHDWGGKDYRDLLSCIDAVNKTEEFRGMKWAVKGGSYGGYMVNWMIGHTDFFTCAISERSTCNRYSQAGTSDCAFRYGKFEFEGLPWEHCESYMEHSPITYVKNVNTPVLLIHGDNDMNCPIAQSEEWYSALRLEKKEAYFARFRGQNHSFSSRGDPKSRRDRYRLLVWWLDRYMIKKDGE